MLLIKNPRFLNEYKEFKEKIDRITDDSVQKELSVLLNSLVNQVKKIDSFHVDFAFKNPNNELMEVRSDIVSTRKKIYNKIKECEKAGIIK